jgi:hypothetical protein
MAGMRNDIDTGNGLTSAPGASADDVAVVNARSLAERYVALWNEPDPDARRDGARAVSTGRRAHPRTAQRPSASGPRARV